MANSSLIDAVARFTSTDVDAFRREWNSQMEGKAETPEKQQVFEQSKKQVQAKNLVAGGISVNVFMKYTSLSGELKERDVVIRRVFKNGKNYLIDVLCLDVKVPRLIKMENILQIKDKRTNITYSSYDFFKNVLGLNIDGNDTSSAPVGESRLKDGEFKTAIDRTRNEITALLFLSTVDGRRDDRELKKIAEYVHKRCPDLTFDDDKLMDYFSMNYPDTQGFYFSLERIIANDGWIVKMFLEKMMSLIVADGKIDEKEKLFLADFLRILEEEGFELNFKNS
ncbi:MAG: TerB family tellurite resistance protein [Alphaproteobacteria bacterium]|nr:TerB family tellurite resistance protein [Alphaproteobacteria bacterium]